MGDKLDQIWCDYDMQHGPDIISCQVKRNDYWHSLASVDWLANYTQIDRASLCEVYRLPLAKFLFQAGRAILVKAMTYDHEWMQQNQPLIDEEDVI